jgi:exosortase
MRSPAAMIEARAVLGGERRVQGVSTRAAQVRALLAHPFALVLVHVAALWPVWHWYVRRVTDGSDEPWGVLALLAVLLSVWGRRGSLRQEPSGALLTGAGLLTMLSVLGMPGFPGPDLPALVRACLGVSALALTLAAVLDRSRPLLPLWALLLLALPVVSSLQFYLGYPLRAFTAWASAAALGVFGMSVMPTGAVLQWQGRTVLVDAPCSGVHMLWVGMFLTTALSYLQRASATRLALNLAVAFIVVLLGNVLRNTLLFIKEARIVHLPEWTHVATGLGAFILAAVVIASVVRRRPRAC